MSLLRNAWRENVNPFLARKIWRPNKKENSNDRGDLMHKHVSHLVLNCSFNSIVLTFVQTGLPQVTFKRIEWDEMTKGIESNHISVPPFGIDSYEKE